MLWIETYIHNYKKYMKFQTKKIRFTNDFIYACFQFETKLWYFDHRIWCFYGQELEFLIFILSFTKEKWELVKNYILCKLWSQKKIIFFFGFIFVQINLKMGFRRKKIEKKSHYLKEMWVYRYQKFKLLALQKSYLLVKIFKSLVSGAFFQNKIETKRNTVYE